MQESKQKDFRIGFAGTPEFAASLLRALIDGGYTPKLILTQPDRPTGRGRKTRPSPVRRLADASHLPIETPTGLKDVSLKEHKLDLLIVAAYGLILPEHILSSPRLGCLNVHASLLPRWRGAAPVERAIMAGDAETGVCLMQMDEGLDTGPVYRCEAVEIGPEDTGGQLEARLAETGGRMLINLLPEIERLKPVPQAETGATYAKKLTARDSQPDLNAPASALARQVRALSDRQPVTFFAADESGPVRIRCLGAAHSAAAGKNQAPPGTVIGVDRAGLWLACKDGSLCIPEIQLNRGKGTAMDAKAAANGYPELIRTGTRLAATAPADGKGEG